MQNAQYWKQRFTQLENAQNQMGAAALKGIEQQYEAAQNELEAQMYKWYSRIAANNGVSMTETRKLLSGNALKEFRRDIGEYIKYGRENAVSGAWIKELENASAKIHISRLEAMKIQTRQSLETLFAQYNNTVSGALGDIYKSSYYHTAYELQKGFNIGWDIAGIDPKQLEKVPAKPWAPDEDNFSERICANKSKLINDVHTEISRNIMLGQDPQKAIDAIAKKLRASRNNAGRLVMTEEAYFSSAAQRACFDDMGVEQYEIIATMDGHTSDICKSLDGKVFSIKDYEVGITAPPFHVNCRSTTAPHFDENFTLSADGEKTYRIPDDMSYDEWKKTFVDGGDKSGLTNSDDGGIINGIRSGLERKEQNSGVFAILTEPMQQRHIKKLLNSLNVDFSGIEIDIIRDKEVLGKRLYGYTFPNGKRIQLYPDAFSSRKILIKTIGHERIHCEQIKLFGLYQNTEELLEYERAAYFSEEYWWDEYVRRTGYNG